MAKTLGMNEQPYIEWDFLKNVNIDVGDGEVHQVKWEMREVPDPMGKGVAPSPYYFVGPETKEHEKTFLQDERVKVPKTQPAGMSDRRFEDIRDQAFDLAKAAKAHNDIIRISLNRHVAEGNIKIVDDPFGYGELVEVELEMDEKALDETPRTKESPKPKETHKTPVKEPAKEPVKEPVKEPSAEDIETIVNEK